MVLKANYVKSVDMLRDVVVGTKKPIFIGTESKIDIRSLKLQLHSAGYSGQVTYTESKNIDKTQQELLIAFVNRHRCLPVANDVIKFDAEITKDTIGFVFVITGRRQKGESGTDTKKQKKHEKKQNEDPDQREWERSAEGRKFILDNPGPPLCLLDK